MKTHADETLFSEEGIEANTEALIEMLSQAQDADEQPPRQRTISRGTSRRPSASNGEETHHTLLYALLLTLLTSFGAVVGALLFKFVRA